MVVKTFRDIPDHSILYPKSCKVWDTRMENSWADNFIRLEHYRLSPSGKTFFMYGKGWKITDFKNIVNNRYIENLYSLQEGTRLIYNNIVFSLDYDNISNSGLKYYLYGDWILLSDIKFLKNYW